MTVLDAAPPARRGMGALTSCRRILRSFAGISGKYFSSADFPRTLAQNTLGGATDYAASPYAAGIDQAWRGIVRKLPAGLFSLALAATAGLAAVLFQSCNNGLIGNSVRGAGEFRRVSAPRSSSFLEK